MVLFLYIQNYYFILGDLAPFEHLTISGYDHIIDVVNDEGVSIKDIAGSKGHDELVQFLESIRSLEVCYIGNYFALQTQFYIFSLK